MDADSSKMIKKVKDMYTKLTFSEGYGGDIWISAILLLVFFLILSYYSIINKIAPLKADWNNVRCDPSVIPFAGIINNSSTTTPFEFTQVNFTYCIRSILETIVNKFFEPIYFIINLVNEAFAQFTNLLNVVRELFAYLREKLREFTALIMTKVSLFTIPLMKLLLVIKDLFEKAQGLLITMIYTLIGGFYAAVAAFKQVAELIVIIILIIFALWLVWSGIAAGTFVAANVFPPFTSFLLVPAGVFMATAVAHFVAGVLLIALYILYKQYISPHIGAISVAPAAPSCFDPETKVELQDGSIVAMKDVPLNSKLKTGIIVQAVMHISNTRENGEQRETMYTVKGGENDCGIVVSGSHLVYDPEKRRFVHVRDITNQNKLTEITDKKYETLCCLITSDHTIPIGNWLFHDWEDNNGSPSQSLV
jgi:hypothetical protein